LLLLLTALVFHRLLLLLWRSAMQATAADSKEGGVT
jgi:hypothetical protein